MRLCLRAIGRACGRTPCCWRQPGGDRFRPQWGCIRGLTTWVRGLVGSPVIGEALYRLNTLGSVIALMYRSHAYTEAGRITPAFVMKKQAVTRRPGARFGSVAFVTGSLDPVSDRSAFLALFERPPVPSLVLCGNASPPRSKSEMTTLGGRAGIDLRWVAGALGMHEECSETIADPILRFASGSSAAP
jgi:hypothetical protein